MSLSGSDGILTSILLSICPFPTQIECDCFYGFAINKFNPIDPSTFDIAIDENTTMDVYFSGKWTGLDAIIEYFSILGGDFVTTPNPISDYYFDFSHSTDEECVALMVGPVRAKSAQEFSLDGKIQNIDFVIGSEFIYELPDDSEKPILLTNWNTWLDPEFIVAFAEILSISDKSYDFVCDVIVNDCAAYSLETSNLIKNQTISECITQLRDLPKLSNETYLDGDSSGCRLLHGLLAKSNEEHCPHVSFEKEIDVNGKYKCYESKFTTPEMVFTQEKLDFIQSHTLPYESANPYIASHPEGSSPQGNFIKALISSPFRNPAFALFTVLKVVAAFF